ncbi:restriction endonuclease subunit S [Paenibacillus pini]
MTEHRQKLVPEIRFKGFTNAWEQRRLSTIIHLFNGNSFSSKGAQVTGIRWLKISNVSVGKIDWTESSYLPKEFWDHFESYRLGPGDYVMALTRPVLKNELKVARINDSHALLNQRVAKLMFEQDAGFGFQLLRKRDTVDAITNAISGTDPPNLSAKDFEKVSVVIPSIEEQKKIGEFFESLDNLITLHKRKLDGLVTLKDGFLQQMFPAGDEVMPRVRFAGFTGNWEERRLGEMLTERNEQFEESEDYPLMSFVGNVGVVPKGEQYDRSFLVKGDDKKYKKTELNDFIYSSNNLETGSIGLNRTGKAVISPVYSIFYSSNDSESLFVGLLSKRKDFINKMIHYRQGVMYGQWRIHERDFLKIIVLTPTISEQNRIIDFFKNIDEQIAAQTAKLKQLRQLKVAYLQRMFI